MRQNRKNVRPAGDGRPWWWDGLTALAFWGNALVVGKFMTRTLGPIAGLFVFAILAGLGWFFGRAAWQGLMDARDGKG